MAQLLALKTNRFFLRLQNQPDIFLALVVIAVVSLLVMPIPTFLIDILICANISSALIILLLAIYIHDSLKLSTFPTILLLSTLFRLGLNVATSRLILLHADAGEMVLAFGNTVVGGNLVVGVVIFILLMLINMLVVAKGSERVAEVAARFTLDAMPGKQMSIDADLRSGVLDLEQAKKKRDELSRESQLFGAMDGAMKFVKGDVIAGIIIFIVNIIAGIIIGKLEHGMELDEALSTYTILSVGDGLVSIIPGLLMSLCAGLIVTRVDSSNEGENLGTSVANQIFAYPKAYLLAGVFIGIIGLLPGLPGFPFAILSFLALTLAIVSKSQDQKNNSNDGLAYFENEPKEHLETPKAAAKTAGVLPICIEVSENLVPFVDDQSSFISELIPMLRESLEMELGIDFPGIRVRGASEMELKKSHYNLLLNEVPIEMGCVKPDQLLVSALPHELKSLGIEEVTKTKNPCTKIISSLTDIKYKAMLEEAGFMVWDAPSRILLHLSGILRKNAKDFITLQESQMMLDRLEHQFPALVKEVVPKAVSLFQLTDILKRLLSEEVSIKDIKTILQTLAEFGPVEQNTIMLTEHVRTAMARYLCYRFGQGHDTLLVFLLSAEIEDMIRSSIEPLPQGSYLALEPDLSQDILAALRRELDLLPPSARQPVILTTQDIRRFVRKLIELEFFEVAVLSFQELSPDLKVQPVARISIHHNQEPNEYDEIEDDTPQKIAAMPPM